MNIRIARIDDAKRLLDIYGYYVMNTAISFEYEIPSEEDFRSRIENTLKKYPYLVAEEDGKIVGYAYASQFHSRKAYIHGAELSIYVDREYRGKGIGTRLYCEILDILIKQNVLTAYACIAETDDKYDKYLTDGSIRFHQKQGFELTGRHVRSGLKFDRWYNIVWLEKVINDSFDAPKDFIPFSDLENKSYFAG